VGAVTVRAVRRLFDEWRDALAIVFVVVTCVLLYLQAQQEATDRVNAIKANEAARRSDCEYGNKLREALRVNVVQGQKDLPLILRLLPQVNNPTVLRLNRESVAYQLVQYAARDCEAYALEAQPGR
jgi:hypothetical protein